MPKPTFTATLILLLSTGAAFAGRQPITVLKGAPLCPQHGDVMVYLRSGELMPQCGLLAHDTPAYIVRKGSQGIVGIQSGTSSIWYTVEADTEAR